MSHTRGVLLNSQVSGTDLEDRVETAEKFYQKTTYLPVVMGAIALALSLIMGVILHEAFPKAITSGNVLILDRKIKRTEKNMYRAKVKLEEFKVLVKSGISEFYIGLNDEIPRRKSFVLSPFFILILAALLILLLVSVVRGEELDQVYVLKDLSKSGLAEDYAGMSDFQKNYDAVGKVIKKLKPGTEFNVIGITENSFGKPYFIMNGCLPSDKGAFGEKLAKAKIAMIENWKKMEIMPVANETDLISCFSLVSCLFDGKQGKKTLIIFSDMRNTVGFDLEKPDLINESIFMRVEDAGVIPRLDGVSVWALGVSPNGKTMKYFKSLKKFWMKFFEKAGAQLECFSMEREWKSSFKKGDGNERR